MKGAPWILKKKSNASIACLIKAILVKFCTVICPCVVVPNLKVELDLLLGQMSTCKNIVTHWFSEFLLLLMIRFKRMAFSKDKKRTVNYKMFRYLIPIVINNWLWSCCHFINHVSTQRSTRLFPFFLSIFLYSHPRNLPSNTLVTCSIDQLSASCASQFSRSIWLRIVP